MKRPSELFKEAQKRALLKPYENKFQRGDVIMNVSYGVVSLVVEVIHGKNYRQLAVDYLEVMEPVQYELKDIKNEKSQKDITKKRSRYQQCTIIDQFYEQVNPDMARLLYGVG